MLHITRLFLLLLAGLSLTTANAQSTITPTKPTAPIVVGAEQMGLYLNTLRGKRVGLVVNQTSMVGRTHLADTLKASGITIRAIFAPEHGFRGQATDGETVKNSTDTRTGIPILSLYGANRKPSRAQMDSLDILVFDIQDVGARFYTFISTMHYVMEACAEANKPLIVLDRPNPNGHYVDGPVLDLKYQSFVGMHPIPVVHGLTVGELARMINGEHWLKTGGIPCPLTVIPVKNYTHALPYDLPVPPSPNLPNRQAVLLYPSICFFEATVVSVGRGTDTQFQVIGGPDNPAFGPYQFTPVDKPGAVNPPQEGKRCYGLDLRTVDAQRLGFSLAYLIEFYKRSQDRAHFFLPGNGIDRLAGSDQLRQQIGAAVPEKRIRQSWEPALGQYKQLRMKYLLYK
jgi:uncharacterized protein YbbC (DUF1343 family)